MWFPANSSHMYCVELAGIFPVHEPDGYAMLMSARKGETAIHGYHVVGDMAVCMCEVLARPWDGVCVPPSLTLSYIGGTFLS